MPWNPCAVTLVISSWYKYREYRMPQKFGTFFYDYLTLKLKKFTFLTKINLFYIVLVEYLQTLRVSSKAKPALNANPTYFCGHPPCIVVKSPLWLHSCRVQI